MDIGQFIDNLFISPIAGTISEVRGDLERKGVVGTLGKTVSQLLSSGALNAARIPSVPQFSQYSPQQVTDINQAVDLAKKIGQKNLPALLELQKEATTNGGLTQVGTIPGGQAMFESMGRPGKWLSDLGRSFSSVRTDTANTPGPMEEMNLGRLFDLLKQGPK